MDVKINRLFICMAVFAIAAVLLVSGVHAAPVTPEDGWIAAEDWDDTKEDEPDTTAAPTTTLSPKDGEQIVVSGKKIWNHGANPAARRPDSITVIVKADGTIVIQRLVSANDHWAWSFKLPKYNRDGKEIAYTVDEARFENYVKQVEGYNLVNTYMPGHNTDEYFPPGASLPKTDDSSNLTLWLVCMGVSLFGLAMVIVIPRRKRREGNRV